MGGWWGGGTPPSKYIGVPQWGACPQFTPIFHASPPPHPVMHSTSNPHMGKLRHSRHPPVRTPPRLPIPGWGGDTSVCVCVPHRGCHSRVQRVSRVGVQGRAGRSGQGVQGWQGSTALLTAEKVRSGGVQGAGGVLEGCRGGVWGCVWGGTHCGCRAGSGCRCGRRVR